MSSALEPEKIRESTSRTPIRTRPIDHEELRRHLLALDEESRINRFGIPISNDEMVEYVAETSAHGAHAISPSPHGTVPEAVAEIIPAGADAAEIAVSVLPHARGRGLGRAVIAEALDAVARDGFRRAVVNVPPGNNAARRAALAAGMRVTARNGMTTFETDLDAPSKETASGPHVNTPEHTRN